MTFPLNKVVVVESAIRPATVLERLKGLVGQAITLNMFHQIDYLKQLAVHTGEINDREVREWFDGLALERANYALAHNLDPVTLVPQRLCSICRRDVDR